MNGMMNAQMPSPLQPGAWAQPCQVGLGLWPGWGCCREPLPAAHQGAHSSDREHVAWPGERGLAGCLEASASLCEQRALVPKSSPRAGVVPSGPFARL